MTRCTQLMPRAPHARCCNTLDIMPLSRTGTNCAVITCHKHFRWEFVCGRELGCFGLCRLVCWWLCCCLPAPAVACFQTMWCRCSTMFGYPERVVRRTLLGCLLGLVLVQTSISQMW
jgi:hypothetical protein